MSSHEELNKIADNTRKNLLSKNKGTNDPSVNTEYIKNSYSVISNQTIDTNLQSIRNNIISRNLPSNFIDPNSNNNFLKEHENNNFSVIDQPDIDKTAITNAFNNLKNNYGLISNLGSNLKVELPNSNETFNILNKLTDNLGEQYTKTSQNLTLSSGLINTFDFNNTLGLNKYGQSAYDLYIKQRLVNIIGDRLPYLDINTLKPLGFIEEIRLPVDFITGEVNDKANNDSEMIKLATQQLSFLFQQTLSSNIKRQTIGRFGNILDAVQDPFNLVNILVGNTPLNIRDYQITSYKGIIGKSFDFATRIAGVEFPINPIPKYKRNITNIFCNNNNEQLIPHTIAPNEVILDYTSKGQKSQLFYLLKHNKFTPSYVDSNNSLFSRIFGNELKGFPSNSYISTDFDIDDEYNFKETYFKDRSNDNVISDLDNSVKDVVWYTPDVINSGLDLDVPQGVFTSQEEDFYKESILCKTKSLLNNSTEKDKFSSINQVNKYFYNKKSVVRLKGENVYSRGNAVKKFNIDTQNVDEVFCRVWTKTDRYENISNLIRPSNGQNYNLIIDEPNSTLQENGFVKVSPFKKIVNQEEIIDPRPYMFSIENLAWVDNWFELPDIERGRNNGRLMWFPPYDLKIDEIITADWNKNTFIGRPEPIYTYNNTERVGNLSFKIIVDHPSILSYILSEENSKPDYLLDQEIESFFAGCHFYSLDKLLKVYPNLPINELNDVQQKLVDIDNKTTILPDSIIITDFDIDLKCYFDNDLPGRYTKNCKRQSGYTTKTVSENEDYGTLYNTYVNRLTDYTNQQNRMLITPYNLSSGSVETRISNVSTFFSTTLPLGFSGITTDIINNINNFDKTKIKEITLEFEPSTSNLASTDYNLYLAYRRVDSVIKYIVKETKLKNEIFKVLQKEKSDYEYDINKISEPKIKQYITGCTKTDQVASIFSEEAYNNRYVRIKKISINTETDSIDNTIGDDVINKDLEKREIIKTFINNNRSKINYIPFHSTEQEYFKYIEKTDKFLYDSLTKKLKHFHPAFHSLTPEGLNSRTTFLQQCVRPGNTIQREETSDREIDIVSNTVFGRPPICVLRVGDFYHSKIVINNINFDYEPLIWDMNPEGIGIQPMLVNVSMNFNFIGNQNMNFNFIGNQNMDFKDSINKLQNALTFNYFANTELYDVRSDTKR